jgi:enterochelin esterase family protein
MNYGAVAMENELQGHFVSPQVHADRRVTFRLRATQAKQVLLDGLAGLAAHAMTKNADGVWELTLGPLAPEIYSYQFIVDGMPVIDPHNRRVKKWLSLDSLVEVPGDPPLLYQQQLVPHGVLQRHIYWSTTTKSERNVLVYVPPGYAGEPAERYPLVVLLHGYGDDESAWTEVGRAHWIADNLLAQGNMRPSIIAMPYGHPLPIDLRVEFDVYARENIGWMEKDLLEDLLPYLLAQFRLHAERDQRAIVGLSMGGGQSLRIGLRHLDQFAWIGGFSSSAPQRQLSQQFVHLLRDVSATNDQLRLLWIACGKDDFLAARNQQFAGWLSDQGIRHTYRPTDGGHEWSVWRRYLAEFLPQLFRG